jgi:hypothetical protein
MKLFYYFLLACIFPLTVSAQANYHTGWVLKNNGDTLKGYINYREWNLSPKSVEFKTDKNDTKILTFTPQTIKAFAIDGMDNYITYYEMISMDKTRFPDLPANIDTSKKRDTVFLKQVATGKYLTLYYNADEIKARYFTAEANSAPVELIYHEYYVNANQTMSKPFYKGQLLIYVSKYSPQNKDLLYKINNSKYDRTSLLYIINGFNGEQNHHATGKGAAPIRFFVGLAVNSTKNQVYDPDISYNNENSNTIAPKLNFGIDIFGNPNVQQVVFRAELSFTYTTAKFDFPTTATSYNDQEFIYSFNQYNFAFTPQILFNIYNEDNFKFYLDGGFAVNFSTYSNNMLVAIANSKGAANTVNNPYTLEGSWINIPFQAGVVLNKKVEFYVSYSLASPITTYVGFHISDQFSSLGVKYLFGK